MERAARNHRFDAFLTQGRTVNQFYDSLYNKICSSVDQAIQKLGDALVKETNDKKIGGALDKVRCGLSLALALALALPHLFCRISRN